MRISDWSSDVCSSDLGGTLEGKSDMSIFASVLTPGASAWGAPQQLSFDPDHSEQNPVLFTAPDGRLWLFHTSQPSGNQDECRIRMVEILRDAGDPQKLATGEGRYLDLPRGCFVRAPLPVRDDGAWLRSEERRVGHEGVSTCKFRRSPDAEKQKQTDKER